MESIEKRENAENKRLFATISVDTAENGRLKGSRTPLVMRGWRDELIVTMTRSIGTNLGKTARLFSKLANSVIVGRIWSEETLSLFDTAEPVRPFESDWPAQRLS